MTPGARGSAPTSAALTGYMALFLVLNAFALNGMLWLLTPEPFKETTLQHTWDVLNGRGSDDSWGVMAAALDHLGEPAAGPLYGEVFLNRNFKFQYPPSSLFPVAAMRRLAPERVRTNEQQEFEAITLNDMLGWGFILLTAASAVALLEIGLRQNDLAGDSRALIAARAALVLGLALTFYPIVKAYTLGQMQVWLDGLFALALLCWVTGKRASSGVLIGLMCLVKPHYGLFLLWAVLRREWRFVSGCAGMGVVGMAASIAVFGWANNVDYLRVLWFLSQHGEAYYPNQSVNGLLNRLMSISDPVSYNNLVFRDDAFPPFNPWVYGGTLVASLVILAAVLLRRGTQGDPNRTIDFCTMALSLTVASPIAWEHHYGILLPVFAVLLAGSLGNRRRLAWLVVSYVLISTLIAAANLLAPTIWNVAQSYLLAAAVVLLVLMHSSRPGWQLAWGGSLAAASSATRAR